MTGRTRRASTSSVETVDDGAIQWCQEASILRSVPKAEPSDNWPIFQLRNAIVLNRDGTTIENALNIVPNGPYIVRGHLHFTRDEKRLVLVRARSPIPIEIRHCLLYSVGETEDGSPQIWVSGRAGWFELSPCPAYQATYDTMCQATTLYYSIMDIIEDMNDKPRRGRKSKSPPQNDILASVFHRYAASVGDGSTYEDVVDRCNKHAVFLISQFLQDDGVIDWKTTPFYKWLKSENGHLFEKVDKAKKNPRQRTRSPSFIEPPRRATTSSSRQSESMEVIDESASNRRSAARLNSAAAEPEQTIIPLHPRRPEPPQAHPTDSPFQTVFAALESCFDALQPSKNGVKVSGLLNRLYFQYRFPTYKDSSSGSHKRPVEEVLHYNAAALLDTIDHDKYKDGEIYDWLVSLSNKKFVPVALRGDALPYRVVPREQRPFHGRKSDVKFERRQEGVREPSPATPRMGKRPGRPVGSKSSLRPIKSTNKRARAIVDDDETDTESVAKKLNLSDQEGDENMDDAGNQGFEEEEPDSILGVLDSSDSSSDHEILDDEAKPAKLSILAEKLPDPMPTGYHGTWVCDQQDCDFIARGGEEADLDERISAHLQEHEQLVDKMQLAVAESRGLLPINHLLEKLKQIGEGAHGPTDTQGNVAPRPIKRHLFV
ncbi:hypothetical protein V2A60_004467 [Cordyceps javanica]|uniref:DNA (cytosine-5)-methyltransferase 1 replication foci domain-containing protein n=1 Tax=Cordyceps javanica TaxID=43265 RepID=A0A545URS4_9HYPO|nr:hypothetical protein IF1G_09244 [Cordyceps javanica]TQW04044.1 hypothetical protein IF2G_08358 [Cordyceps javanica]